MSSCRLLVADLPWPFATTHAAAIDAHWTARIADTPSFFNGTVLTLADERESDGRYDATLRPIAFKEFLYWRDSGCPEAGIRDVFGSAIVRTADGALMMARQRAGNLNAGLTYFPGGFIDLRDISEDGTVDIEANIRRELAEETGLTSKDLIRAPGIVLTKTGAQISIGVELHSPLDAAALADRISSFIAADASSELEEAVFVRSLDDLQRHAVPDYALLIAQGVLDN